MIEDKFKLLRVHQDLIEALLLDEANPIVRFRSESKKGAHHLCLVKGDETLLSFPLKLSPRPKPPCEPDYLRITPVDVVSLLGQFALTITQCYSARLLQAVRDTLTPR